MFSFLFLSSFFLRRKFDEIIHPGTDRISGSATVKPAGIFREEHAACSAFRFFCFLYTSPHLFGDLILDWAVRLGGGEMRTMSGCFAFPRGCSFLTLDKKSHFLWQPRMHVPCAQFLRRYSMAARCLIYSPWFPPSLVPAIPPRADCSTWASSTHHTWGRITPAERHEREATESRRRLRWSLVFLSLSATAHLGHHAHHLLPSFAHLGGGIGQALQVLPTGWVDWLQAGVATVALAGPGEAKTETQYQIM